MLTDTVYGIVTRAHDKKAVERLYRIRRKTPKKPFIILVDSVTRLKEFGVRATPEQITFLKKVWPGKVSVILPCPSERFSYLHLGTRALAFRLPRSKKLQSLIREVGPLVAPSANLEGEKPAQSIQEAKAYFGETVALYVSSARKADNIPSTLVSLLGTEPKVLREGGVTVKI